MATDQEQPLPESFQQIQQGGFESSDIHRFQLLQLNSTPPTDNHHQHQFTDAANVISNFSSSSHVHVRPLVRCTSCGSTKRRSPSPLSSLQEPPAKRAAPRHPAATVGSKSEDLGSGKVFPGNADGDAAFPTPVEQTSQDTIQNALNRSLSDITSYMGTQETGVKNGNVQAPNLQLGETSGLSSPSPAVCTLPPLPPVLIRSLSEPIPSDYHPVAEFTPSRSPSTARTFVPSPGSDQESVESKRLRRIKERMKQMSQWAQKVASEEDMDEDTGDRTPQRISETVRETRPNQEAVWVEENGENLMLHFRCPCERRYEIFLSGRKCYYRLM